jgi:hypothetical protein
VTTIFEFDRQLALKRLEECKRIGTDRNTLVAKCDNVTFRLAELLNEISEGRYAEECFGQTFDDFVEGHFRDERGVPRTLTWAKGLTHQYRTVEPWDALVGKLQEPPRAGQPYVSFSGAYFTARLAELEDWPRRARRDAVSEIDVPKSKWTPENFQQADLRAGELLHEWLVASAMRPTRHIRREITEATTPAGDSTATWPFIGGRLNPEVKEHADEILVELCMLEDDGPAPEDLTFVQSYERLVQFADDCLQAFRAVLDGNQSPLSSLIKQLQALQEDAGETE